MAGSIAQCAQGNRLLVGSRRKVVTVLADALGLTPVHINRVLRQLRELDLLTLHKGSVRIHDLDRLRKLAAFESGYLNSRK